MAILERVAVCWEWALRGTTVLWNDNIWHSCFHETFLTAVSWSMCLNFSNFPSAWKQPGWLSCGGLVVVLSGEILRKLAMITAGTNFNHYVQQVKHDGHQLVTHGVYAISRHPSYVGWFYWSVGTQVGLSPRNEYAYYTYLYYSQNCCRDHLLIKTTSYRSPGIYCPCYWTYIQRPPVYNI